jgi:hypothetical protein
MILNPALPRRLGHLLQGGAAVGLPGVGVQVATDIFEDDQLRQRPFLRRLDFAAVLPQLREDVRQADLGENLLLGAAGDALLVRRRIR